MIKEVRAAIFILAVFFGGIIFVAACAKIYAWEGETVIVYMVLAVIVDLVALAGYAAYDYFMAVKTPLFRTEFGYRGSLRAVYDLFIERHNIRMLLTSDDKLQDAESLHQRIDKFISDDKAKKELKQIFTETLKHNFNLTYLYHPKQPIEGWDVQTQARPIYRSFMLLHPQPEKEQFVFGQINDVWHGNLFISHPHGESMNLKVVAWSVDPFTNEPMPICLLKHSSINYDDNKQEATDVKLTEALQYMVAKDHEIIESLHKEVNNLQAIQDSKLHDVKDISRHGHEIAKADTRLFKDIMKEVSRGWLHSGLAKVIVSVALIAGIVLLVAIFLHWIDLGAIFGGG